MSTPTEHKTVQARILLNGQLWLWDIVSQKVVVHWFGFRFESMCISENSQIKLGVTKRLVSLPAPFHKLMGRQVTTKHWTTL